MAISSAGPHLAVLSVSLWMVLQGTLCLRHLQACLKVWVDIGASEQVLVQGVPIVLWGQPPDISWEWPFLELVIWWYPGCGPHGVP
jgi:hypothetical protein